MTDVRGFVSDRPERRDEQPNKSLAPCPRHGSEPPAAKFESAPVRTGRSQFGLPMLARRRPRSRMGRDPATYIARLFDVSRGAACLPAHPGRVVQLSNARIHRHAHRAGGDVCERGRGRRSAWREGWRGANSLVSVRLPCLSVVSATRGRVARLSSHNTRTPATRNGTCGVVQAAALACACRVRGVGSRTRGLIGCHLRRSARAGLCMHVCMSRRSAGFEGVGVGVSCTPRASMRW